MTLSPAQAESRNLTPDQSDAVLADLKAILASDSFSSSNRCRDFLDFVVKRALAGDYENLTERFIGVEIFGRTVDYETATDAIVRVRANDVRRRLGQYSSGKKSAGPVRIDLIAGGYIPEFHWRTEQEPNLSSELEIASFAGQISTPGSSVDQKPAPEKKEDHSRLAYTRRHSIIFWWSCAAATVVAATLLALTFEPRPNNFDRFWLPVLQASSSPVLVLPTTDTLQLQPEAMKLYGQLKPGGSMTLGLGDVQDFHNWHTSLPVMQATL